MARHEFGDDIEPREGFEYPKPGDVVTALQDYQTPAFSSEKQTKIKAGDVGTVIDNRKPHTFDEVRGYMGLVVHFNSVSSVYSSGLVIAWDKASDPAKFAFSPAPPPEPKEPEPPRKPHDEFGNNTHPRENFIYPSAGDEIIAVGEFKTWGSKGNTIIRPGDKGVIKENRMPGTLDQVHGYIGLVVYFDSIRESYPSGIVIKWDTVTDKKIFSIPSSETQESARTEQAVEGMYAGAAEPVKVRQPFSFKKK
ncbi:MAG: hypothetical protein ACAH80_16115 [Alphaproteobacteria bacterium]